jgi:two-component system cell cycle sensor histidine kinase/response regulator CckA
MVRQSISIQQRLMLLFGGTFTVIVVLVGATIYMTGRSAARSVAIERLTHVSEELVVMLGANLKAHGDTLAAIADGPEVARWLQRPDDPATTQLAARLSAIGDESKVLRSVDVRDGTGALLFRSWDRSVSLDSAQARELIAAYESPKRMVVGPLKAVPDGAIYQVISRSSALSRPVYVIGSWHSSQVSTNRIRSLIGGQPSFFLGNSRGDGWTDLNDPLSRPRPFFATGDTVTVSAKDETGVPTIARGQLVPRTPWLFVVEYPYDAVYGRVNLIFARLALTGVVLLLAIFFASWWFSRALTRPLDELSKVAGAISTGDLSRRVAAIGVTDFDKVGASFNRMADSLVAAGNELDVRMTQLSRSEARYRALFDSNPHCMWVYDVETLQFLAVNASAVQRYGHSHDEFAKMSLYDIRPAESLPHFGRQIADAAGAERRVRVSRHQRKDGRVFDVEIISEPLLFEGRPARLVLANDISDRRRIEESLRFAQERLQRVVTSVGAVIYELEVQAHGIELRWISDALMSTLGYPASAAYEIGWWSNNLHPNDSANLSRRSLSNRMHEGAIEYRFRHSNGSYRWIRDEQRILRDVDGRPISVIGALIDVTTNHELQDQLLQSQKVEAIGRLAGGVAHDFNNLLTVILGECALVLLEPVAQDASVKPSIDAIHKAAERATLLTRQLLSFARKQLTEPITLSLNDVVTDTNTMLNRLLGEDIIVNLRLDRSLGQSLCDRGQLEQVLVNLSVNARDAMPEGGVLTIETQHFVVDAAHAASRPNLRAGGYVLLRVSDTGGGLTAEAQRHLFEPFFTTKERGKGTGLGLATCYSIIRQCDGHIEVLSEAGVGTSVVVYLPVTSALADRKTPTAAMTALVGDETVLLVEDEAVVRKVTARMLESLGYTVVAADGGASALRMLDEHRGTIDLLMSDVVMPAMGGRELAERVRQLRPTIKILFASGYSDDVILNHQLLERDVVLVQKPFTVVTLSAKIREALDHTL